MNYLATTDGIFTATLAVLQLFILIGPFTEIAGGSKLPMPWRNFTRDNFKDWAISSFILTLTLFFWQALVHTFAGHGTMLIVSFFQVLIIIYLIECTFRKWREKMYEAKRKRFEEDMKRLEQNRR